MQFWTHRARTNACAQLHTFFLAFALLTISLQARASFSVSTVISSEVIPISEIEYAFDDSPNPELSSLPAWLLNKEEGRWKKMKTADGPPERSSNTLFQRIRLPQSLPENPYIFFQHIDQVFTVFYEGKELFRFGDVGKNGKTVFAGSPSFFFKLDDSMAGKEIVIKVYCELSRIGVINTPQLGSAPNILAHLILRDLDRIILGFIFLTLGIFTGAIAAVQRPRRLFLYSGGFSIVLGVWFILRVFIKQLFVYDPVVFLGLEIFDLILVPILASGFMEHLFGPGPLRVLNRLRMALCVFFIGSLLLVISKQVSVSSILVPMQIILLLSLLIMMVCMADAAIKHKLYSKIIASGLLIFLISSITEVLMHLGILNFTFPFTHWGLFVFNGFLLFSLLKISSETMEKAKQANFRKLGHVGIRLADKLGSPLNILVLSLEEVAENNLEPEEKMKIISVMNENIAKIREEVNILAKYRAYAPEDALNKDYGLTDL